MNKQTLKILLPFLKKKQTKKNNKKKQKTNKQKAKIVLYCSPDYQRSFESIGFLVQEKFNIGFQDGAHGDHLRFPIGIFLAIFDLQVTLILQMKLRVNRPFG